MRYLCVLHTSGILHVFATNVQYMCYTQTPLLVFYVYATFYAHATDVTFHTRVAYVARSSACTTITWTLHTLMHMLHTELSVYICYKEQHSCNGSTACTTITWMLHTLTHVTHGWHMLQGAQRVLPLHERCIHWCMLHTGGICYKELSVYYHYMNVAYIDACYTRVAYVTRSSACTTITWMLHTLMHVTHGWHMLQGAQRVLPLHECCIHWCMLHTGGICYKELSVYYHYMNVAYIDACYTRVAYVTRNSACTTITWMLHTLMHVTHGWHMLQGAQRVLPLHECCIHWCMLHTGGICYKELSVYYHYMNVAYIDACYTHPTDITSILHLCCTHVFLHMGIQLIIVPLVSPL